MARKSKVVKDEIEEISQKLKQLEEYKREAEQEEENVRKEVKQTIDSLCEENNYFCGVILTPKEIASIVQFAIETNEPVQIPYQIYPKD